MKMQRILLILAITAMFMELSLAATYTVGSPNGGWDTSTDLKTWASTQSFFVGDSLLFQYTPNHDVLEVTKTEYDSCDGTKPITSDNSGTTTIPLSSAGKRYFICGTQGHCGQGMKVEIDTLVASAPPPASPATPPPASPSTPPPASPPATPPPASPPATPPPSSSPPPASPPARSPVSSPSPPTVSPPKSASSPPPASPSAPPPSSAHKCSFQATLAMGVGFVMVFLAL